VLQDGAGKRLRGADSGEVDTNPSHKPQILDLAGIPLRDGWRYVLSLRIL